MNQKIFEVFIEELGEKYKVIKAFDATQEINLNGVLAVNINQIEPLLHGEYTDYKYTISINGQTFTEEDPERKNINEMFGYCKTTLKLEEIKRKIPGCVGAIWGNSTITSDGETNNFAIQTLIFICS